MLQRNSEKGLQWRRRRRWRPTVDGKLIMMVGEYWFWSGRKKDKRVGALTLCFH